MNLTWLADCFEKHYFFRRSIIYLQLYLVYDVTQLSYAFMMGALQSPKGMLDVVAQIGALQGPILVLLGYTYAKYNTTREKEKDAVPITAPVPSTEENSVVPDSGPVAAGPR